MDISVKMNALQHKEGTIFSVSTDKTSKESIQAKSGNKAFSLANKEEDPIAQRKAQAFEKARKIVSDAFDGERKIDAEIQELRDLSAQLVEDNKQKIEQVSENKSEMEQLQKQYGVLPDSGEQKDLELLMKKDDATYDPSVRLTEEEQKRYDELTKNGITEYQSRMMERYSENNRLTNEMQENLMAIRANGSAIRFIKGERLKTNPIGEAEDAAEKVMEAERDAILGTLVGDAMEHVQEQLKEKAEAAEQLGEEAQEREERIEELTEKIDQQSLQSEETKTEILSAYKRQEMMDPEAIVEIQMEIQKEIDKVLEELKLLTEDLKGNAIDKLL